MSDGFGSPNRHGKIACLPRNLREEANQRLADRESGVKILAWLNMHPDVQPVLEREFGGRAINLVNLSAWRRGGYQEWRRHHYAVQRVERKMGQSPSGGAAFLEITDELAREFAIEMKVTLQRALDSSKNPIKKWKYLQQGMREINALRMYDIREQERSLTHLKRVLRHARNARLQTLACDERFDGLGQIKADKGKKTNADAGCQLNPIESKLIQPNPGKSKFKK